MAANEVVLFDSFPKQDEAIEAAFDDQYTLILYGGAIRGGKTFWGLGTLVLLCLAYPGSRWAIVRTDWITMKRTTVESWNKMKPSNIIVREDWETKTVTLKTSKPGVYSDIIFFPENFHRDKELNRWRGLEVNGFLLEEINELQYITLQKAIERAGSHIIPGMQMHEQPIPKILATCNPTQGWVKEKMYTPWKENKLPPRWKYIHSRIFDNPHIPQSYIDNLSMLGRYFYEVFVLGNWDVALKVGGEFFKNFELEDHLVPVHFNAESPIHVSVDNNVQPYIAITLWQIYKNELDGWDVHQVGEILAKDPKNTATSAGREVLRWLRRRKYELSKVYIYGDPTTRSRNTIDDSKKSFLDKFTDQIRRKHEIQKRMFRKAPPVSSTGDFINAIYRDEIFGIRIMISESCSASINDYIETKEDKDGAILKQNVKDPETGITYEKNAHLSDTKRYFLAKCFYSEFRKYLNRLSDPQQFVSAQPNQSIRGGI